MTYFATRAPSPHWDVYRRSYGSMLTSPMVGRSDSDFERKWKTPEAQMSTPVSYAEGSSGRYTPRGDQSHQRPGSPTWADRYTQSETMRYQRESDIPSPVVPSVGRYTRQVTTPRDRERERERVDRTLTYESPRSSLPTAHRPSSLIPPQNHNDYGKYVLVLDLDETLVYARCGPVTKRPGASEMLQFINNAFETVLWTAGERGYAMGAIRQLDTTNTIKHHVCRDGRWFKGEQTCVKDLRLLARDMSKCLIIENTPDCVRGNPDHAIIVPDYLGGSDASPVMATLQRILGDLARSRLTVPEFLSQCRYLQRRHLQSSTGELILTYTLASCSYRPPAPQQPTYRYEFSSRY